MGKKQAENKRQTRSQKTVTTKKPIMSEQFVMLKTQVWQKDSHGLFDYEAQGDQYLTQKQKIIPFKRKIHKNQKGNKQLQKESRIFICRTKDCHTHIEITNTPSNQKNQSQMLGICQIIASRTKRGVSFKIRTALRLQNLSTALQREAQKVQNRSQINPKKDMIQKIDRINLFPQMKQAEVKVFNPLVCPFTVAKNFHKGNSSAEGYPLRPGNIIKFGRVQYVVVEMKTDKQMISLRNATELKDVSGYEGVYEVKNGQDVPEQHSRSEGYVPTCKVCLCSQQTQEDVLISPCNCKGYCGVIHIDCLKQWINSKVKKEHQDMVASYNFNKFECQICKMPFPQVIKRGEQRIQMMGIQKPNKPYIIIESINPPRSLLPNAHHRQEDRSLHVISSNEKSSLKIGRGHSCEIRISDISVSRNHAQIELCDNKFLIKDTKSKFGTLVLFDQQFVLSQRYPLMIQSGRCLYQFSVHRETMQSEQGVTQSENQQVQNSNNEDNQNGENMQSQNP